MGLLSKLYNTGKQGFHKFAEKNGGYSGLIGKGLNLVKGYIPENYRYLGSKIADTALSIMPDSELKETLTKVNDYAHGRTDDNLKSKKLKLNKKTVKALKMIRKKDGIINNNSARSTIVKAPTIYGRSSKIS